MKDLPLLAKGAKYIVILSFVALIYSNISISFMMGQQLHWSELAYICVFYIPSLWIMIKVEKYLRMMDSFDTDKPGN